MKKILLTTATIFAISISSIATAGFQSSKHNWNGQSMATVAKSTTSTTTNNTLIANSYNRSNSVSNADIVKIGDKTMSYNAVLNITKAEKKKAQKVGYEWNTIRKLIKAAGKDHKKGDDKSAIKKLNTAISHAKLGQKQAVIQKNAGPRF